MNKYYTLFSFLFIIAFAKAQQPATLASDVESALKSKKDMLSNSLVKNIPFKNVGPTVMSGRVVDIDVNKDDPTEFYVGYASGGVWHTTNNGTSFTPVLDAAITQNVGDLAVDWSSGTIWVGTGEPNASRSSYAGVGILKSTDGGKSWENKGLTDTHHIGRIVINPNNPDEVLVAAVGHLYSENESRGVYKTTDGGESWSKTLFVSNSAGVIDMVASPQDFNILYASSWEKDRKAWNFIGNGEGSAIYKSNDAGNTWQKISTASSGFPTGNGVGRIGLAAYDNNTIYAVHDSQFRREEREEKEDDAGLSKEDFRDMSTESFLALDNKALNTFLKQNDFQEKYRAENVKQMIRIGDARPIDLVNYLEDANSQLFDTPVIGAELYRSDDGGTTWQKMNEDYIDGLFYSYGYYFAMIQVDPNDKEKVYLGGVPIIKSDDGGKTWASINGENVHADHHALWVDPNKSGHLINGNDGGINISYDDGETWIKNNSPAVGQFYAIEVDNQEPYHIYGGLQDNGVWVGSHTAREDRSWHQEGQYPWQSIMGGDGMQVEVDNRDPNIVYTGFQFGNYFRINRATEEQTYIQPKHELGETPYRFNWQTPILLSPHNQDILYLGGNKLMRSMNQGTDWTAISDDLTKGGKKGNVAYGTLTTISESPFQFGLIYTGSDDGKIYVSKDAGGSWTDISRNLPQDLWVSRVVASAHQKSRVYATLNGYRWDDFKPYVYVSDDHGQTWKAIKGNLPISPINVIVEDPSKDDMLYLGTDDAAYISFNMGKSWEIFDGSMPRVAVHDMVIQDTAKDLVIGTHGRSIYKADISILQQYDTAADSKLQFFELEPVRHSGRWGSSWSNWSDPYTPSLDLKLYSPREGEAVITIYSEKDKEVKQWSKDLEKGFNIISYDLSIAEKGKNVLEKNKDLKVTKGDNDTFYLPIGEYKVTIKQNGMSQSQKLVIE